MSQPAHAVTLGLADQINIHELFRRVYPDSKLPFLHWAWMMNCPCKYIAVGIVVDSKLVAYMSAIIYDGFSRAHSAMVDPDYQGKGFFSQVAHYLYTVLELKNMKYVELFANKTVKPIYLKHQKFIMDQQIRQYMMPVNVSNTFCQDNFNLTEYAMTMYDTWRYTNHPHKKYMYYIDKTFEHCAIYSIHEDRLQIIEYDDWEFALLLGLRIANDHDCKYVSFWHEEELPIAHTNMPTWRMYKHLVPDLPQIKNKKLRMGNNTDVF